MKYNEVWNKYYHDPFKVDLNDPYGDIEAAITKDAVGSWNNIKLISQVNSKPTYSYVQLAPLSEFIAYEKQLTTIGMNELAEKSVGSPKKRRNKSKEQSDK